MTASNHAAPALDRLARPLRSLRISVTDRCNLRCAYCMPEEEYTWLPKRDILSFEELSRLVDAFGRVGVERLRLTGGEPLLQLDEPLAAALHAAGFSIAIETNGTLPAPEGLDWICVSPKAGAPLVLTAGNELKLVYPQTDAPPEQFEALAFRHFYLQPMDGPDRERHTDAAVAYCAAHPLWKLSLQTHKLLGIP